MIFNTIISYTMQKFVILFVSLFLSTGTTYYVRAFASNHHGLAYGNQLSFTTDVGNPTVNILSINSGQPGFRLIDAIVTSDGGAEVTARGFVWDTQENPTLEQNEDYNTLGSGIGEYSGELSGLTPNTRYYVRAYASNSEGTGYSEQRVFHFWDYHGTLTDIDDNTYNTIMIGDQKWMAENLRAIRYNNGDSINTGLSDSEWITESNGAMGIYPHSQIDGLDSEQDVLSAYGALYNWYAVTDERGICPVGWRVPSINDWQQLVDYLVTEYDLHNEGGNPAINGVGNALKSCRQVNSPNEDCNTMEHPRWGHYETHYGTDDCGFSAVPGGYRVYDGIYSFLEWHAGWWSSSGSDQNYAYSAGMNNGNGSLFLSNYEKIEGFSIRCVRNSAPGVKTLHIINPQYTSAIGRGEVVHDGGSELTARGLVWSTHEYPDLEDHEGLVTVEGGVGAFSSEMVGLVSETTYYVRAYATNDMGTSYGEPYEFFTAPRVFFSSFNHTISGSYENLSTRYFEVSDVGWVAASINEEYEEFYYPGNDDYNPPGSFVIVRDNIAHADFNQNGLQDFVVQWVIFPHTVPRESRAPISIFLNNGDGTFRMAPELMPGVGLNRFMAYRIKTADFNQNGRPDIVAGSMGMIMRNPDGTSTTLFEPIPLLLSNDDGTYYDATTNIEGQENGGLPEGFSFSHDLAVGDVVGNGYPDIYAGKVLLINDGTGYFQNRRMDMPEELRPTQAYIMSSAIGDLNNDGIEDIVTFYSDNNPLNISGYIWLSQDGDPSFENRQLIELPPGRYGPGTKFNYAVTYDVNLNGLNDIVVAVTRDEPYYVGATIQIIINKGDGIFVDETDLWVKLPEHLEDSQGEGQLFVVDANNNGILDLVHMVGDDPGAVIYLNTGNGLAVVDSDVLPFVQAWQVDSFPYGGPNGFTSGFAEGPFPIDIYGNGNIGFISSLGYPAPPEHPSNQWEQTLYSIISTRPIPLVHINNALEAELIGHLNTLSDSGWVEESVDEVNSILLDYKEAPVEEWRDVFFDYFKEFHLTQNLMAYVTHQPFADTDPTVRENLQGGLFFALSKLQSEILSKENLADSLQSKPSLGEHLLLTNKLFFDFFLHEDSVFDSSLIVDHYEELFSSMPEYFKLTATIDTLLFPMLVDVKNQMLANLASYNYLQGFEQQEYIAGIAGVDQLTDVFRQTVWQEYSLIILDNNVLNAQQTEKIYQVLSLLPREYHNTVVITTNGGYDHSQGVYSTGAFSVLTVGLGEEVENIFPLDTEGFETDRFTLSAVRGLLHRADVGWIDQHATYKEHKDLLIQRAGSDSLNYLQSGVDEGFYTWHPQGFFPHLAALYFVNSRQALNLAISRMHQNIKHPMDQFLFAAEVFGDQQQTWFYEIDGMGCIYKQPVDMQTNHSGFISELTVSDNERYFFLEDDDNMALAVIGVVVSHISCYNSMDGSIALKVAGDDGFTVSWDDGDFGLVRQDLDQGQYTLLIQNDALGFEKELSFNLEQPELLEVDFQVSTNGMIDLHAVVSGGTPPYTYLWEDLPGQSSHTLTDVDYGTYTVHISDANDCKTSASITLEDPTVTFTITATAGDNGTIQPLGETVVEYGQDFELEIIPDQGYFVYELIVDGESIEPALSHTFEYITQNHTIHVEFSLIVYTITATAGEGGTINPSGEVDVDHGSNKMFTIAPDHGYLIDDVLVDDVSIGSVNMHTFVNVTKDHTIHANFGITTYTLVYFASHGGSLDGETEQVVEYGADGTPVEAIPNEGYHFVAWDDGLTDNPRTDTNVTADLEVEAGFALTTYVVTFIIENEHGETIFDAVVTLDQTENPPGDYVFEDIEPGDYSYTVTGENYFDASGELEVVDQDVTLTVVMQLDDTGIAETLAPEITIFPNPVRNTLHVESNIRIYQIQLLDILGQRVITQTVGDLHHELIVSDLKDGLYFIQVFTDRGVKTLRVQIIK